jgi:hypothetical protein
MNYSWSRNAEASDEYCELTHRLEYAVRVRASLGTVYLWGSAGIPQNATFQPPVLLHIRNDKCGEVVTLAVPGAKTPIGTLNPGECYSIAIQNISGVTATCALESTVYCVIKAN